MNVFSPDLVAQSQRFSRPRFKTMHYVAVLFGDGSVDYLDQNGDLSPRRDDACEYDDLVDAETDCSILTAQDFDASVETFQRFYQ